MIRGMKVSDLHPLLTEAFQVFDGWPENFYGFLDRIQGRNSLAKKPNHTPGIYRDFQPIYIGLYRTLDSEDFAFMREAFETYVKTRWGGDLIHAKYKLFRPAGIEDRNYVGKGEARKALGVPPVGVDQFAEQGLLKLIVKPAGKRKTFLVEKESIQALQRRLKDSISIKDAMEYLGVDRSTIRTLSAKGVLPAIQRMSNTGVSSQRFEKSLIENLMAHISASVSSIAGGHNKNEVDFWGAVHTFMIPGFDIARMIEEINKGSISPCREDQAEIGLRRFRFDKNQLLFLHRTLWKQQRQGIFSGVEASKYLGMHKDGVFQLIKYNLIKANKIDAGASYGWNISEEELCQFKAEYITLKEISNQRKYASWRMREFLENNGVFPVVQVKTNASMPFVYRRSDISLISF
jgi:DNA-binding transcriptional MerR regulator